VRTAVLALGANVLERLLEQVGQGRRTAPVWCRCGARMASEGRRTKTMRTILGPVRFRRSRYRCPLCRTARTPGDETLGCVGTRFSPGAQRMMARAGSREPFREAADDLRLYANLALDGKDVERVAERVGRRIDAWMQKEGARAALYDRAGVTLPELAEQPPPPVAYVSFDGTGVPVRGPELSGRKGKQADGSAKTREVKLGCVFTQTRIDKDGRPVRDEEATTYVGAIESSTDFGHRLYQEAVRRGVPRAGQVAVLTDGAAYNKSIVAAHFPQATHIIDLYHAREHLHDTLKLLLGPTPPQAIESKWSVLLDAGKIESLVREIEKRLPRSGPRRKQGRCRIGYFTDNAELMRYAEFRRRGLFVGSGVIEAGCRMLIGQRLKNSGMFWSVAGANAIIASRCCQYSGRFEQFWEDQAA
jgi:hypothetical protein